SPPGTPSDGVPGTAPAEILVHPNGRLLFASNRRVADVPPPLADSIAPFALDPATGLLTPLPHATAGIANPRHLALDPTGTWLYASNQSTGTIVPFRLDPATGALAPGGDPVRSPTPVCLVFGRA
ncbi:MAG: 6-phosphogluconolactonase, partial [uncultured Thermomicrobiales bacterium]